MSRDHERHTRREMTAEQIVAAAERGDEAANSTLARYEGRMARALGALINVLDPDVIVLGGGMSKVKRLYANVPRLWIEHVFGCGAVGVRGHEPVRTRLLPAVHGDASGVRGAAWLWL